MLEELRKYRIFGIPIFDLVVSMIGMSLIFLFAKSKYYPQLKQTPFILAGILLAIPIGITTHILIGRNTTLNYRLGLSNKPVL